MKHTDEEAVFLLCVVLAFVSPVGDTELMERSLVAANLKEHLRNTLKDKHNAE